MNNKLHWIVFDAKGSATYTFFFMIIMILSFFYLMNVFDSSRLPSGFETKSEFLGQVLLITILPGYLLATIIYSYRNSLKLAQKIERLGPENLSGQIHIIPRWKIILGGVIGFLYSLFNLPSDVFNIFRNEESAMMAITFGQMLIWSVAGILLALRLQVASVFALAGKTVSISPFNDYRLKAFGWVGLTDVLIITMALVLTTVQSIDAQFRMYNYVNAFIVSIPAMLVLMIVPMYSLHRRLMKMRNDMLYEVNQKIRTASTTLGIEEVNQMESYLKRRDRVLTMSTWPLDMSALLRFLFYVILPPVAWICAAATEVMVQNVIGS